MVLPQYNLTKFKHKYLKSGFWCKKDRRKHKRKFYASLEFDCFRDLKFAFRIELFMLRNEEALL